MSGEAPPGADLYTLELLEALRRGSCALCAALEEDEQRYLAWFWPSVRTDAVLLTRVLRAGGLCASHARRLGESDRGDRSLSRLYRLVARRDAGLLEDAVGRVGGRGRRPGALIRDEPCPACAAGAAARTRKAQFLADVLAGDDARADYLAGDGLCMPHLEVVVDEALRARQAAVAKWLLADAAGRLRALEAMLDSGQAPELVLRRYTGRG
jgi:hypothetical protein